MKLKHLFLTFVNNADIDRLAEQILEQTNCQNN